MSDFIESLKRLYRNKMLKNEQLDHLISIGKISKEEFEYIKRKEG